ncbi:MAG: restriction endonuclease subunit S [Petrimonas sp.]|jgi:restriction endonuclease S subunit
MLVKISDIATVQSGIYLKELPEGDAIYLQVKDFECLELTDNQLRQTVILSEKSSNHLLQEGDLLFAAKGTSNFCVKYPVEIGNAVASSAFFVIKINSNKVLPDFIAWFLNLPDTLSLLRSLSVGTSIPSITKVMLEELSLNLPDIQTQKKVVEFSKLQKRESELLTEISQNRTLLNNALLKKLIKTN